jgi:hypothetical protein
MPRKLTSKQHFSLQWDYLRQSKLYQDYVIWYESALKQKTQLPEKIREKISKHTRPQKLLWRYFVKLFAYCQAKEKSVDDLLGYFRHIHHIHEMRRRPVFEPLSEYLRHDPIFSAQYFNRHFLEIPLIRDLRWVESDLEGSVEESVADFIDFQLQRHEYRTQTYVITLGSNKPHKIKKAVDELLKKHRPRIRNGQGQERYDSLKRYLKAYVLHKRNLRVPEIIEKMGSRAERECDPEDIENIERNYRRYITNAKKYIRLAEKGLFPPYPDFVLKMIADK